MMLGYSMHVFMLHLFVVMPSTTNSLKCKKINSCKCEMDDGSGIINLRSLAHPGNLPKWTLSSGDGWMYKYNPCLGYALGSYSDLAVSQASTAGTAYDLGVQSNATFNVTEDGEVVISYFAKDKKRSTRIILKCDSETRYDKLDFIGEIRITEYDMLLSSPCACPGYCDNYGLFDEIAKNMSGYWENQYGGLRINPSEGLQQNEESKYPWSGVGTSMVALLFHDVVLILLIASIIVINRHFYLKCLGRKKENCKHTSCNDNIDCGENICSKENHKTQFRRKQSKYEDTFEVESEDHVVSEGSSNISQQMLLTNTK